MNRSTILSRIYTLISTRPSGLCNFLDAPYLHAVLGSTDGDAGEVRVVYRNYATLYFVVVVDGSESELGILDLIQVRKRYITDFWKKINDAGFC